MATKWSVLCGLLHKHLILATREGPALSMACQLRGHKNRAELYLKHRHEGVDLRIDYAHDTLRNLHTIWTRPVHIETTLNKKPVIISFDGSDFSETKIGQKGKTVRKTKRAARK